MMEFNDDVLVKGPEEYVINKSHFRSQQRYS